MRYSRIATASLLVTTIALVAVGAQPALLAGEPAAKQLNVDLGGGVKLELVLVPKGSFVMGHDRAFIHEKPAHPVTISKPFYLGKFEVTQEQWEAVMGTNPSRFKGAKNPVERVTWNHCREFLRKLNEKTGRTFALPTEAQWEYACRAGSTTWYCFGDDAKQIGEYAWYDANSAKKSHPVGQKKPNAWGLYDMHGNVVEWCRDWHGKYTAEAQTDPTGPESGQSRIQRGGCWQRGAGYCGCPHRNFHVPDWRDNFCGLRVCLNDF